MYVLYLKKKNMQLQYGTGVICESHGWVQCFSLTKHACTLNT